MVKGLTIELEEEKSNKLSEMLKDSGWHCRESVIRDSLPRAIFCSGVQLERPFEELELDINIKRR